MEPPDNLEHFRILRRDSGPLWELGRGSMGVTYKAWDTRLDALVALKVIKPEITQQPEALRRFQREAQAAAKLRHPNIATVSHFGVVAEIAFYVMEYCDGPTVQKLVEDHGPLSITDSLSLGLQVAKALSTAEVHKMLHRDLKPSNLILTTRPDERLALKVIDFGLACSYSEDSADRLGTVSSAFTGTVWFASPEQLLEKRLDIRSDFYALGACIWFMLCGRPVFDGSMAEIMASTLNDVPPVARLPEMPKRVRELISCLLEKDAGKRPASALLICSEIEKCLRISGERVEQDNDQPDAHSSEGPPSESDGADPAQLLARFTVGIQLDQHSCWTAYEGEEVSTKISVRVYVLRPSISAVPSIVRQLKGGLRALQACPHPNVSTVLGFGQTEVGWIIVARPVGRTTVFQLLRKRGSLTPGEALLLLTPIASALDHLESFIPERQSVTLSTIMIDLADGVDAASLFPQSVKTWPDFTVTLNALGLGRLTGEAGLDTISSWDTVLGADEGNRSNVVSTAGAQLASIFYELLGGIKTERNTFVSLPRLTREANELLTEAQRGRVPTATLWISKLRTCLGQEIEEPLEAITETTEESGGKGFRLNDLVKAISQWKYLLLVTPVALIGGWVTMSFCQNRQNQDPRAPDKTISILEDILRRRQAMTHTSDELQTIDLPRLLQAQRKVEEAPGSGWEENVDILSRAVKRKEEKLSDDRHQIDQWQSSVEDSWDAYPDSYEEAMKEIMVSRDQNPQMEALAREFTKRFSELRINPDRTRGHREFLDKLCPPAAETR